MVTKPTRIQPRLYVTARHSVMCVGGPKHKKESEGCVQSFSHTDTVYSVTNTEHKPFCFSCSSRRSRASLCLSSILLKSSESVAQTRVKQQNKLFYNWDKRLMMAKRDLCSVSLVVPAWNISLFGVTYLFWWQHCCWGCCLWQSN